MHLLRASALAFGFLSFGPHRAMGASPADLKNLDSTIHDPRDVPYDKYSKNHTISRRRSDSPLLEFGDDPSKGAYIKVYRNENEFRGNMTRDDEFTSGMSTVIRNAHSRTIWPYMGIGINHNGGFKIIGISHRNEDKLPKLESGEYMRIGNLPQEQNERGFRHNGAIHVRTGCNHHGEHCDGISGKERTKDGKPLSPAIFSKAEWTDGVNPKGDVGINLSLVDGFNLPTNMYFENSECRPAKCIVSIEKMIEGCPLRNQVWSNGNFAACRSDCKLTESDEDCCTGAHNTPATCSASSTFFHDMCPGSYSYAYDDMKYHQCTPQKIMFVSYGLGK